MSSNILDRQWYGQEFPIPLNEAERLNALRRYKILDTLPEEELNNLVEIAAFICDVPVALISLIDSNKQWLKAKIGIDVSETERNLSFCQYAIMNDELLEINDTNQHALFKANPLVRKEPFIRFYAGTPLKSSDGYNIGTLCVIDSKAKKLTSQQKKALDIISRQIINQMELRLVLNNERSFSEMKHHFISMVSHQFRTPLTIIKSNLELLNILLKSPHENKAQAQKYIDRTHYEIDYMTRLLDDIVILNKLYSEKLSYMPTEIDVKNMIDQVIGDYKKDNNEYRNIKIRTFGIPVKPYVDQDHFKIIFRHLLSNAFKYSSNVSPEISIIYNSDNVAIEVTDYGVGILESDRELIFQPFYRAKNVEPYRGTGLGLAIIKEYMFLNGGKIELDLTRTSGTCFRIIFPVNSNKKT